MEKKVVDTISGSGDIERLKYHLDSLTGRNTILVLFSRTSTQKTSEEIRSTLRTVLQEAEVKAKVTKECIQSIYRKLKRCVRSKKIEEVKCSFADEGWVFPLYHGGLIYGFLCVLINKGRLNAQLLKFVEDFLLLSLEKALKEIELIKVHSNLRPRAIALSTVHTVHRLISSTLNMDELLPRLARLCLQVTRSKTCIIYVRKGNKLQPSAVVSVNSKPRAKSINLEKSKIGRALDEGAVILTPRRLWVPLMEEELVGVISLREKQSGKPFDINDREIVTVFAEQAIVAIKNAQLYETQSKILMESLKTLSKILDVKSPKTYTHPLSFVDLVMAIADEYGVSPKEKEYIKYATLLLDTGKVAIPEEILKKPGRLTPEEYRSIMEHPLKSAEIVKSIKSLKPIVPIILYHHERYDGKGYPKGLRGRKIPLGARILCVADAFEAMICHRPYKKSLGFEEAVEEIKKQSGRQFDPHVVDAFLRAVKKGKIKRIACRMLEEGAGK
ncbi:MAG: HD-GYP domain-containing protein [Candidatus Omnitrophica bacterium]|nr:HD-GYP domain-containing protein [Candidatus Omnitrophota bacterium]